MLSMEQILRGLRLLEDARESSTAKLGFTKRVHGLHCLEPFSVKLIEMFQCDDVEFLNVDYLYNNIERKEQFYFSTENSDASEEFLIELRYDNPDDNSEEYKYLIIKPMFSKRFGIEILMCNLTGRVNNTKKFEAGMPQLRELLKELVK